MSATSTSSTNDVVHQPDDVRAVHDDEVGFFHQNGWVLLRGLVAPHLCQEMPERGKPVLTGLMEGSALDFATPDDKRRHMTVSSSLRIGYQIEHPSFTPVPK